MIVGVVSDTHLPKFGRTLPRALVRGLTKASVELVVHCGDVTERFALDLFNEIAPVVAVAGNNDGKALHKALGEKTILEAGGARIGVVHGHVGRGRTTPDRAFNAFAGDDVGAILFGHSHIPHKSRRNGVLLFNPGSPTDKRINPLYSYGILRIVDGHIDAAHRFYLSRSA
jgi:putative phosphoesterase